MVCSAVCPKKMVSESCPTQWLEINKYICQIESKKDLRANIDGESKIICLQPEYLPLMKYLSTCVDVLRNYLNDQKIRPYRDPLQKMYTEISKRDVSLAVFRKEIDKYHKKIREEIETGNAI